LVAEWRIYADLEEERGFLVFYVGFWYFLPSRS
jgi:hypothetical protein